MIVQCSEHAIAECECTFFEHLKLKVTRFKYEQCAALQITWTYCTWARDLVVFS